MKSTLKAFLILAILTSAFPSLGLAENKVEFISPHDGDTVTSPFTVKMGVSGMSVEPAGDLEEDTGHHHLIVNSTFIEKGKPVPADEQHIHFGAGQTQTELTLPPGKHKLTLQFADGLHRSYGEDMSASIEVTVK